MFDASELSAVGRDATRSAGRIGAKASAVMRGTVAAVETSMRAGAEVLDGDLRRSITAVTTGDGRTGSMTAVIGSDNDHAWFNEFGTSVMAAQPFAGPAFDKHIEPFIRKMSDLGGDIL